MVHNEPISREHLSHLPQLGAAAFCDAAYYLFLRPRHAEHPEGSWWSSLRKQRERLVSPNIVGRVAVADDADPWVDVGLVGVEAEGSRWMAGRWVDGKWHSSYAKDGELHKKVPEGRVLGYSFWRRDWPKDPKTAQEVMRRCGAGSVWPSDAWWKKLERGLFSLADAYFARINPDPAVASESVGVVMGEGQRQFTALAQPMMDRSKDTGFIYLESIAVDPDFSRRGLGVRMMRWGLERSEQERCPILLIATSKGEGLYSKVGFESQGSINLPGLSGDKVMVYWPKSFESSEGGDVQQHVVEAVEKQEVKSQEDSAASTIIDVEGV